MLSRAMISFRWSGVLPRIDNVTVMSIQYAVTKRLRQMKSTVACNGLAYIVLIRHR